MHINLPYIAYYLLIINLVAASAFYKDKQKAIEGKYRTRESRLHLYEICGGVLVMLPMLYLIRHKNRKFAYFIWTYITFIAWIILLIFVLGSDILDLI